MAKGKNKAFDRKITRRREGNEDTGPRGKMMGKKTRYGYGSSKGVGRYHGKDEVKEDNMPDNEELENEVDLDDIVTTSDLVGNAMDEKPYEFKQNFGDILLNKIRDAVDERKVEIAQAAIASDEGMPEEPEDYEETPDEDGEYEDNDVDLDAVDDEQEDTDTEEDEDA